MPKLYQDKNVYDAARERISITFDGFERIYIAFSGGKDSSVMMHLVMDEAIKRGVKVAVMYIDFEAQYKDTADHVLEMFEMYKDHIDPYWVCCPMKLRNALTVYEPQWTCWDESRKDDWIRAMPENQFVKHAEDFPFNPSGMEFEEFIVLFGEWYGQGKKTAGFIGIRSQESLHRYCAIATWEKINLTYKGYRWTTKVVAETYNVYPIYDWLTEDIWRYHAKSSNRPHNVIYDKMQMAGVPLSQQRLCQPFGDDQRRGLWLYHILEPETWFRLVARVSGANSGSLYIGERGNVNGYGKVTLPSGHNWKSFTNLLLATMPKKMQTHYADRFRKFIAGWKRRGYDIIPDEAPPELESKQWAPSWRRMAKCILRNDYWCKGLGQTQPKSEAYKEFKRIKHERAAMLRTEKKSA